jgi:hypothetical protein
LAQQLVRLLANQATTAALNLPLAAAQSLGLAPNFAIPD